MSCRGRPSKGCESCRARKIRCDETKPVCNRCIKQGNDCKYRNQADLLFRNQTASAAQRAEDSWRKRSKSNQRGRNSVSSGSSNHTSPASEQSSPIAGTRLPSISSVPAAAASPPYVDEVNTADFNALAVTSHQVNPTILQELGPDLRRLAYERFVYDFVAPESSAYRSGEPSDALWEFLPELYRNAGDRSCLVSIIDAVAYTNFAHRCNAPTAEQKAEECLGDGMGMLVKMIADKRRAVTNETLCAVYFLGVYENISTRQRKGSYVTHSHGANALLQEMPPQDYYHDQVSARLYEVAYSQMLLGNLHAGKVPPLPIDNIMPIKKYLPSLFNDSGVFVTELIHEETTFHAQWQALKQRDYLPQTREELRDFLQTALDLDVRYRDWENTIPKTWQYTMKPNTPEERSTYDIKWQRLILDGRGAPSEIHSYLTLKRCWIWNFFRTTRVFLLRDTLEILNWMFRLPELPNHNPISYPTLDLTDPALLMHRSLATLHLTTLIEKTCSATISSFIVPVHAKSLDEVMGMRGYINLWALGIMDAVLRSGLIPSSSPTTCTSPIPVPAAYQDMSSPPDHKSPSPFNPTQSDDAPVTAPAPSPQPPRKAHVFDANPTHPYDAPVPYPALEFELAKHRRIDVAARREWINAILYYCSAYLGIKKGVYVPLTEGFLGRVKERVDAAVAGC